MASDKSLRRCQKDAGSKLSPESKDRVLKGVQGGGRMKVFYRPKMEPSLLGLTGPCLSYASSQNMRVRPALGTARVYLYRVSALDAYATALLAAHFSYRSLGVLKFTCSLKRSGPESQMPWSLR